MKVGLFGGSFNPPHLAHLIVAEAIREQFGLDRVLWMPNHQSPHKIGAALAAPPHRLAMTRLATAGHPAFDVSTHELDRKGTSYTVHTVRHLQESHPETDFALILGGDSLKHFGAWYRPEEIVERVPLLVYPRPGAPVADVDVRFRSRVHAAEAPLLDLSGTAIRSRCRAGQSIRYLVPEAVHQYILEEGLYR